MRFAASIIICAGFAFTTAAQAQQAPTRTVEDYLCAFAGECGDEAEEEGSEISREGHETSGPRLAWRTDEKSSSSARPSTGAIATRSARQSIGESVAAAATRPTATRRMPSALTNRSSGLGRQVAATGRADLRLEFELGSSNLTPLAMGEAQVFARSIQLPALASKRFLIEGHTDAIGGAAYNQDLSKRRAEAVAAYLAELGVHRERLQVKGYGFDKPLPGRSARSAANRRVEAVVIR